MLSKVFSAVEMTLLRTLNLLEYLSPWRRRASVPGIVVIRFYFFSWGNSPHFSDLREDCRQYSLA